MSAATATEGETKTPPDEAPGATAVDGEGFIYLVETGEVVGHAGEHAGKGEFRIITPEGADWVLEKIAACEAQVVAIEARRAAIAANLDSQLVDPRNRIAWLRRRFEGELIAQAERDIAAAGGRAKTAKYPHGKVARRMGRGHSEITDRHAAVAFVEEHAPSLVKKAVGVEDVRKAIEAEAAEYGAEGATDTSTFFRVAEPVETWSIETGVKKA